jgi:hypothetical protein
MDKGVNVISHRPLSDFPKRGLSVWAANAQDENGITPCKGHQILNQAHRTRIGPVQVVEGQHKRLLRAHRLNPLTKGREDPLLQQLGISLRYLFSHRFR